ncbi:MAG TPA: ATP-binding protein [Candidatus Polarisedimenticolia bacterium]|nr:ATP-binding protein [Candidatus Polarisedimenticolia bacterium]
MPRSSRRFDPSEGLALLGDLVASLPPTAGEEEVCDQGLRIAMKGLGATGGAILLQSGNGGEPWLAASAGEAAPLLPWRKPAPEALEVGESGGECRLALALPGRGSAIGTILLRLQGWDPRAAPFITALVRALASALDASKKMDESRLQGELLARRNVELETLRELGDRIQAKSTDQEILDAALQLLLRKMGLEAGWIFWGESRRGTLELAACRGIQERFVRQAREVGIGPCMCQDVFTTGKLRVARNTLECPRLPDLLPDRSCTSHACIPLKFERGIEGVLNIAGRAGAAFSEQELKFLETVGGQICLAVDKARSTRSEMRKIKEVQEALERMRSAQDGMMRAERLAAVGTLAAGLAHEVRNPLNSINLQLVLLARRLEKLDAAQKEQMWSYIEAARKEIARLDDLVGEFLSLSSLDRVSMAASRPDEIVQEVLELMAPVAEQAGVQVSSEYEGPFAPFRLDREKIKQVLVNLLRNAVEAMAQGGRLMVTTSMRDGNLSIEVADTGPGIPPGRNVFDFFVTTKKGGTGLGLPIARQIVEAHGGKLAYRSRVGGGTVFSVVLGTREET